MVSIPVDAAHGYNPGVPSGVTDCMCPGRVTRPGDHDHISQ